MNKTRLDNWICEYEGLPELTRQSLEALQLRKLNEALTRLRRRGTYPNLPERLDSLSQLAELPFTTPQMLAQSPGKYLLTSQSEISRVISGATSGTTGPAKRVFYTAADTEGTVGLFTAGIGEMAGPGDRVFIGFPFTGPFGLGDLIAQAVERLGAVPVKAGFGQTWGEVRNILDAENPNCYIGFPVTLLSMARMYGEGFPIRRALVSGDACPHGVMEALEQLLGHPLYPHYGSREMALGGAVTCPAFEGMHLRENHVIAEILDDHGKPVPQGEVGELVITTIGMEAMPLLRYRTGDYTRILPPCPCGGITCRLDRVSRREGNISIEDLDSALFPIPGLVDYQVRHGEGLAIDARVLASGLEESIHQAAQALYPDTEIRVTCEPCRNSHRPMYLGKRHIVEHNG